MRFQLSSVYSTLLAPLFFAPEAQSKYLLTTLVPELSKVVKVSLEKDDDRGAQNAEVAQRESCDDCMNPIRTAKFYVLFRNN